MLEPLFIPKRLELEALMGLVVWYSLRCSDLSYLSLCICLFLFLGSKKPGTDSPRELPYSDHITATPPPDVVDDANLEAVKLLQNAGECEFTPVRDMSMNAILRACCWLGCGGDVVWETPFLDEAKF